MYKNNKILAIIPARGGSKGIINKNLRKIQGIPLVEISLIEAKKSKYIDDILISTDSSHIVKIGQKYSRFKNNLRPSELSNDQAKIIDVIRYEISKDFIQKEYYDSIILLQPTSPLRTTSQIDGAINDFYVYNHSSLVSVNEVSEHPVFMRSISGSGQLNKLLNVNSTIRRQDLPKFYIVNGAIYINKFNDYSKVDLSLNDNRNAYIMNQESSVDINNINDLKLARKFKRNSF
jgi:CMP-N-acetylneuraminic acid synthetase